MVMRLSDADRQKVSEAISDAISRGLYAPGQRLPSERELAEEFEVSRPTIREAMLALRARRKL